MTYKLDKQYAGDLSDYLEMVLLNAADVAASVTIMSNGDVQIFESEDNLDNMDLYTTLMQAATYLQKNGPEN